MRSQHLSQAVTLDTAHVLISRTCVNNCIFCAVARQRKEQTFPKREEVSRFIQNVGAGGVKHLVFSGLGEPTLDPYFDEYLCIANDLGFERITLFTNGHGLTQERAIRWKDGGLTDVLLSMHGMGADHDRNVQRRGAFREAVSALQLYTALGLSVTINTCLTRLNLAEIPHLRTFVARYSVKMHTLSFPEWSGNAAVYGEYMADYEEIGAVAEHLIPEEDTVTYFDNIPYCLVQKKTREMRGVANTRLLDDSGEKELTPFQEKLFPASCSKSGCPLLQSCPGFDKNYIAARGWRNLGDMVKCFLINAHSTAVRDKILANRSPAPRPQRLDRGDEQKHQCYHRGHLLMIVKPTYRCNAECLYCSSHKDLLTPDLSPDILRRLYTELFQYAQRSGIRSITFLWYGGEPLLLGKSFYAEAWEESFKHQGIRVQHLIQTNLLLLDRKWVQLLKRFGVRVGTSVDPIGDERIYKDGHLQYPDWLGKFILACEEDVPIGVIFTATARHLDRASHIYNFFKNLQGFAPKPVGLRVNPVVTVGKAACSLDPALDTRPAEYGDFLYQLWELWNKDGRPFVILPLHAWIQRKAPSCEFSGSCHEYILTMDGTGDIYHCGRFADKGVPLGNILDAELTDILQHPRRMELGRRAQILRANHCKGCNFWEYCKGGCPHHAYLHSGDGLQASPFCQGYKRFFEKSGLVPLPSSKKEASNA